MDETKPSLVTFTGPSGSGKDLLVANIIKYHPEARRLESLTTRPVRPHEGKTQHTHISTAEMVSLQDRKELIWCELHSGHLYAVRKQAVIEALESGGLFLVILLPEKIKTLREYAAGLGKEHLMRSIYLRINDKDEQHRRMRERGDTQEAIARRDEGERHWDELVQTQGVRYLFIDALQTPEACLERALSYIFGDRRFHFMRKNFPHA